MIFGVGKLRVRGLSYAIIYMILHLATVIQYLSDGIYRASIASRSKKVNFSHTRFRALGPEQIPVYRQLAHR